MYRKKTNPYAAALIVIVLAFAGTFSVKAALQDDISNLLMPGNTVPKKVAVIDSVCDMIQKGQFQEAREVLEDSTDLSDQRLEQLRKLISEHDRIMQLRAVANREGLSEQTKELDELKLGPKTYDPNSPDETQIVKENITKTEVPPEKETADDKPEKGKSVETKKIEDKPQSKADESKDDTVSAEERAEIEQATYISDIFATSLKAMEYASEEEKKELLKDPFIADTIEKALALSRKFESEGKWVDSYAHCYYWLTEIDKDNKQYKEHSEMLTKMAMIERSLMDNTCDTSRQRHEGITEGMLVRSLGALDADYINMIDYAQMANDGIERARILGEVIAKSDKDLAYQADAATLEKWSAGLEGIKSKISFMTLERFVWVFDKVLSLNDRTMKLPREVLIAQFTKASLESLDPYTTLVWPWDATGFDKMMTGKFEGIGIRISKVRGVLTAVSLIPHTPAYYSGMDADDSILAIDGESTDDMTMNCAVSKITGLSGTTVTLTVKHAGSEETEDITIKRGRIDVPSIQGWKRSDAGDWEYTIDPLNRVGYVRITGFLENTVPGMKAVLKELEKDGLNGFVIDLRFNTGGYLNAAAGIVDLFVDNGFIVTARPKRGISDYHTAHEIGTHPNYPIVVLINGESASASEIVAGALQDEKFKRATIVGQRSYGKGSVQQISRSPGGGSRLKYTMAYYHLPSNQRVKNRYVMEREGRTDWGIAPDVEVKVELRTNEGQKMLKVQNANEILAKADHDAKLNHVKRYSLQETIDSDPQLAVGLLVLKSKIVQAGKDVKFPAKIETPVIAEKKSDVKS